jgi:hypothetical protein
MTTKWNEGDRLKFITTFGEEIIGKVFVHEPETNTLVIRILTCNNLFKHSLIFYNINAVSHNG